MLDRGILYFLFLCCVSVGGCTFGMDSLGYTERQAINYSLNVSLRNSNVPSSLQHKYREILPIEIVPKLWDRIVSSLDQYNPKFFYLLQRVSSYNLDSGDRENLEFKLAGSYAAHLSSTAGMEGVEDTVFNRVPPKYYSMLEDRKAEDFLVCGNSGTDIIKNVFPLGALSQSLTKSEVSLILKLRVIPKKGGFFSSPERFDKSFYIEGVAAALRELVVRNFRNNEKQIQKLKRYLESEYEISGISDDVRRGLQQYGNYSSTLDFNSISAEQKEAVQRAFHELSERFNVGKKLGSSGAELDNGSFLAILRFLAGGDNLFRMYNPMEFLIVNLMYPKSPKTLTVSDRNYWRDSIIGSHRAKYIIENAKEVFSSSGYKDSVNCHLHAD